MQKFTIRDTNICKGIAILFMILHHSVGRYYNSPDILWYVNNSKNTGDLILLFFSTVGKVCVPLLTILSGYGVSKSFSKADGRDGIKKDIKFILSRYIKLYSVYFPIVLLFLLKRILVCFVKKDFIGNIEYLKNNLIDLNMFYRVGFKDWYLTAIIILYLIFPLLSRLIKRIPYVVIALTSIPWLWRLCFNASLFKFDSVISCLLTFSLGILFEQKEILPKLKINKPIINVLLPFGLLLITFILRLVFSLPFDVFFALAIIIFEINILSSLKYAAVCLNYIGKHSASMWLMHGNVLVLFTCNPSLKFLATATLTLIVSSLLDWGKRKSGYNKLFDGIRNFLK